MSDPYFTDKIFYTYEGEEIEVDYRFWRGYPQTYSEPGEPPSIEIGEIRWNGEPVCVHCHKKIVTSEFERELLGEVLVEIARAEGERF